MSLFDEDPFFPTYKTLPLSIERAEGVYIYTKDGRRYLDMFSGIAVNALGHRHPRVLRAIEEQTSTSLHVSNYFQTDSQIALARQLLRLSGLHRVFFTNSGTEATEGAIKIARRFGASRGKNGIVAFSNSFHGRSMGALSLMDRVSHREGYGPFLDNCIVLPFNEIPRLREEIRHNTAAVFVEIIQGEGGVRPASPEFLEELGRLQKETGYLLIVDEVQTGMGRTGKFLAFQHTLLKPDLILLAKALGGGLPLGAILGSKLVADVLTPGTHGSTFGGNPVACAAGLAVVQELTDGGVLENAASVGQKFREGLEALRRKFPNLILEIRGKGLLIGIELACDAESVSEQLIEKGILVNVTDRVVLRVVPPLIIEEGHLGMFLAALEDVLVERRPARSY